MTMKNPFQLTKKEKKDIWRVIQKARKDNPYSRVNVDVHLFEKAQYDYKGIIKQLRMIFYLRAQKYKIKRKTRVILGLNLVHHIPSTEAQILWRTPVLNANYKTLYKSNLSCDEI